MSAEAAFEGFFIDVSLEAGHQKVHRSERRRTQPSRLYLIIFSI